MREIAYIGAPLDATTVALCQSCAAVIPSPNDAVDAATLQLLAEHGVKLMARERVLQQPGPCRCHPLGFKSVYVPASTSCSNSSSLDPGAHSVPGSPQRTRDEN